MRLIVAAVSIFGINLGIVHLAYAQHTGGNFVVTRTTIDQGGGQSTEGPWLVAGTIGQHDARPMQSNGAGFVVSSGFWAYVQATLLFRDGFEEFAAVRETNSSKERTSGTTSGEALE